MAELWMQRSANSKLLAIAGLGSQWTHEAYLWENINNLEKVMFF